MHQSPMPSSSRKRPSPRKGQTLISRFFGAAAANNKKKTKKKEQCRIKFVGHEGRKRVEAGEKRTWEEVEDRKGSAGGKEQGNGVVKKKDSVLALDDIDTDDVKEVEGDSRIHKSHDGKRSTPKREKRRRVVVDCDEDDEDDRGSVYEPDDTDGHVDDSAETKEAGKCVLNRFTRNGDAFTKSLGGKYVANESKGNIDNNKEQLSERNRETSGIRSFERKANGDNKDLHRDAKIRERFERKIGRLEKNEWFMKRTGGIPEGIQSTELAGKNSNLKNNASKVKYTPLEAQFLSIKKKNPDTILMVECGYKFRFFGEDAEIASKVCRIWAHFDHNFNTASVPTHRLGYHLRRLVQAGHKVGVVRQIDTAALKKASSKSSGPFTRELTEVYSRGTMIPDAIGGVNLGGGESMGALSVTNFILAILERPPQQESNLVHIAIAAVDVSTGETVFDAFEDDLLRANLETRLVALEPVELLLPTTTLTSSTERALLQYASSSEARLERICDSEWTQAPVVDKGEKSSDLLATSLNQAFSKKESATDVRKCLSALVKYLKNFNLESALEGAKEFKRFTLSRQMTFGADVMVNFELFGNSNDGSRSGSLLSLVNRTKSAFGSRQLKSWLSHPLTDSSAINGRLEAVGALRILVSKDSRNRKSQALQELSDPFDLRLAELLAELPTLPDLERGLARIFYAKCSPSDFCTIIKAISMVTERIARLKETECTSTSRKSSLLKKMISLVPDSRSTLKRVTSDRLDFLAAESNDLPNVFTARASESENSEDEELSRLVTALNGHKDQVLACEASLNDHLKELRVTLNNPTLEWKKVALEEYLVEVPGSIASRMPKRWLKVNQTSKMTRFRTPETTKRMELLEQARELRDMTSKDAWRAFLRLFGQFCSQFQSLVKFLSDLDCLASLARVANLPGYSKPKIVDSSEASAGIHARGARHPIAETRCQIGPYVSNDIKIGIDATSEQSIVVTGPNMGGKSSYVRMCALLAILSQMGSFVPADSLTLSPFDAIYARMGAADAISKGLSTFMVELSETSAILARATPRSLVILDELGRGTSTHDGTAVAQATLEYMISALGCRTLFVTHFPSVARLTSKFPDALGCYYMDYMEEGGEENTKDRSSALGSPSGLKKITFLYKLKEGIAEKSYGLNVALLADLPLSVVEGATQKAEDMEANMDARQNALSFMTFIHHFQHEGTKLFEDVSDGMT